MKPVATAGFVSKVSIVSRGVFPKVLHSYSNIKGASNELSRGLQ
ncbi:hypothetical protein VIBNISO65_1530032 [Vibrio nigripulchritudo SO65]|nr:hypothetical protein VIBNIAM115_450033 [Vibrio nigripulchritudo AM115]CCN44587.1 hypothetical protein VIBNIFTn2_860032 [Vibrio nigripulchritudo FTn2]CCN66552.1 hypothetical protein VIBNIPon4_570052 [Vibrio nigripulchritudo POn4]CCN76182.1 hypothetical protein VIBNISO65_1530032 [Vibrio nigripulchritudo SO65]